ncbi:MAG: LysE family transporter [Alphaproteobacteria bacterium]|nr:LysE family transporter [Rhodospirillales bacterium]MCW9045176.1 LysE family transporter [Alphaproteobacteria bacterium]
MTEIIMAAVTGVTLGLAAGMAPGPLMTLAIAQTLRHGVREGLLVAVAPLVTDIPIVLLLFFLLSELPSQLLGGLSIVGALYALYLAYETAKTETLGEITEEAAPSSLRRGAIINFLNPHPYLFWGTVGVPYVLGMHEKSALAPWGFVIGFYFLLVGSKAAVVVLTGHYRNLLIGRYYTYVMRGLAIALVIFAILLFREALDLLAALNS